MVGEAQFVEAVARRTGLSRAAALKVTHAVLRSLAERLTAAEAEQVARGLPPGLGSVLEGGTHGEPFDLHELLQRVETRTGAGRERALEYIAGVGMTLGEAVGDSFLAPLRAALPPSIALLLRAPSTRTARQTSVSDALEGLFFTPAHHSR